VLRVGGCIPSIRGESRFNRRWHRLVDLFWTWFILLGETWNLLDTHSIHIIDGFPVVGHDNYRDHRCRHYQREDIRGYQASK
jgi:hypothetical protein